MFADTHKFSFRFNFLFSEDQCYVTATVYSHICSSFLLNYYIPTSLQFNLICLLFSDIFTVTAVNVTVIISVYISHHMITVF